MAPSVTVYEVGPRDGLQNEARTLSTAEKLALIEALAGAGLRRIEATSFVSPRSIPQLADAEALTRALPRLPGVAYAVLVPNMRGLERLLAVLNEPGPEEHVGERPTIEAAVVVSASETHNRKNLNRSIEETLLDLEAVVPAARAAGLKARGYVSTAFGCPYEGPIAPDRTASMVERLVSLGCEQVSLGDTIGVATPGETRRVVERIVRKVEADVLALHMHDTHGTALANVLAGLESGITTFDASIGGLGGCPYAPGASGNLATEDLVFMLRGMGYETGIDFEKLILAGALAERLAGRPLPGKTLEAERARIETTKAEGRTR